MVLKVQAKTAPISNGIYVSGTKSNIGSPTFCRDGNNEKCYSKAALSPLSDMFAAPYSDSRSSFKKNATVNAQMFTAKSKKKSVRFMMDPYDSQKHHCTTYATSAVLTSIDRKTQWYNSAEIKRMRAETYNEALTARSLALPYLQLFQQLRDSCEDTESDLNERKHLAHSVAASQYRGLESLTFIETLRLEQRRTLQEILAAQEDFRDLLSSDELILELQALSIKLSHCSSRLAYMLGVGDADEAKHIATPQETRGMECCIPRINESIAVCMDSSKYEI